MGYGKEMLIYAINQAKTIEEIKKILNNYLNYLKNSIK